MIHPNALTPPCFEALDFCYTCKRVVLVSKVCFEAFYISNYTKITGKSWRKTRMSIIFIDSMCRLENHWSTTMVSEYIYAANFLSFVMWCQILSFAWNHVNGTKVSSTRSGKNFWSPKHCHSNTPVYNLGLWAWIFMQVLSDHKNRRQDQLLRTSQRDKELYFAIGRFFMTLAP